MKIFRKSSMEAKKDSVVREALNVRYSSFQKLLSKNNYVLELMADMEEKLSGEYLFDRHYIDTNVRSIADGVLSIIENLNTISKDKYSGLYKIHADIYKEIEEILTHKIEIQVSDLTIPLSALSAGMSGISGGKIAHLGEIRNRLNLPTPDGFAITAYAFKRFMEHNIFTDKIKEKLSTLSIDNINLLNDACKEIQDMVIGGEVPEDMMDAINNAVSALALNVMPSTLRVSVRSSAVEEDGRFSFAGQYATFLNVPPQLIAQKYKEVVASMFTPQAIFYYKTKGFREEEMVMAVGVLSMVEALSAGVVYTADPNEPEKDTIIINAVKGLGRSLVDGSVTPDSYTVSKKTGLILKEKTPYQQTMLVCLPEGNIKELGVPEEISTKGCLTDDEIKTLSGYAFKLEAHYGSPQDIEWAIDRSRRIYILQSRPLRILKDESPMLNIPRRLKKYNILLDKGIIACKGIGYGRAFILKEEEDLKDFPRGAVLVARHTSTKFVSVMNKASAIVTDVGGATGHMASLSREYQVPTILDAGQATSVIKEGQELTVDAINCNIYEGRVPELLEYAFKKKGLFKDTHLFKTLEGLLKWVVPLNLVDPEAEVFKPGNCRTFHDITRFAHETAMAEIFKTGKGQELETFEDFMSAITFAESGEDIGSHAIALRAGIPLDARLIDIDGCIKGKLKKAVPGDISSIPFSAFLKGMIEMRWPEPRPVDVKGFIGMMAHTASIPEEELYKMGERSFAIVSSNYMNFSIRLGYHFSMVEAYAGENLNDNYIKFFFKGGGAVIDRRLRRVRLVTEILKRLNFRVKVTEDVINAVLTKFKQPAIEEKLETLGRLTAYTKQLDMALFNDAIADWYIEEFVKGHMK